MYYKILSFIFLILTTSCGNSFSQVKLLTSSYELKWRHDTTFTIDLTIINNTDTTIFVPELPNAYAKNAMGTNEIGVEMKLNHSDVSKYCAPSIQYLVFPRMIAVKPGESQNIKVKFPGDYFVKKGSYKVKLFLKVPSSIKGNPGYKYYSSNKVIINMI